jgi:cytoskeletal protein CcmA (bactofilin family)
LILSGEVKGNITAYDRVEIKSKGRFTGNIKTVVLVIEEGAIFNGNASMEVQKVSSIVKNSD